MFKKYSKITNHYDQGFIDKVQLEVPLDTIYRKSEKLHGANFSFLIDEDKQITHCSRNKPLGETESFFAHQDLTRYHTQLLGIYSDLYNFEPTTIQIYGEYAGGNIQKGIEYGDKDFYCIDIKVNGVYIDLDDVEALCYDWDIKTVPVLGWGTLAECISEDNEFNSKILNVEDNVCEGIVIAPIAPIYLSNGERIIIKSKNDKWVEKSKLKKRKAPTVMTLEAQETLDLILQYLNQNRVDSVASKGPIESFGSFLKEVTLDILDDFKVDNPDVRYGAVTKMLNKTVAEFIRPTFLDKRA